MISDKNIRIAITVKKEVKEMLEKLAKDDNRSASNYIETLICQEYAKSKSR